MGLVLVVEVCAVSRPCGESSCGTSPREGGLRRSRPRGGGTSRLRDWTVSAPVGWCISVPHRAGRCSSGSRGGIVPVIGPISQPVPLIDFVRSTCPLDRAGGLSR